MQSRKHSITVEDISNTEKLLKHGFTHAEIAYLIGISETSVSRISTGTHCLQKARTVKESNVVNTNTDKVSRLETSVTRVETESVGKVETQNAGKVETQNAGKVETQNAGKPAADSIKTAKQPAVNADNVTNGTTVTVVHTVDTALVNALSQFTVKLTDAINAVNALNNTLAGNAGCRPSKLCHCKKSQVGDTDFEDMLDDSKYVDLLGDEVCQ